MIWPNTFDCSSVNSSSESQAYKDCVNALIAFYKARTMPAWGIPVVVGVSLVLAVVLYYVVEEPCRKTFRAKGGNFKQ